MQKDRRSPFDAVDRDAEPLRLLHQMPPRQVTSHVVGRCGQVGGCRIYAVRYGQLPRQPPDALDVRAKAVRKRLDTRNQRLRQLERHAQPIAPSR